MGICSGVCSGICGGVCGGVCGGICGGITTAIIQGIIVPAHNKNIAYNNAVALLDEGKYKEALTALDELGGYKDSEDLKNNTIETIYNKFINLVDNGKYLEADSYYQEMSDCFKLYPNYKKLTEYLAYNSLKIFCTAPTEISVTHDDISGYKELLTYISDFEDHEQVSDTINTLDKRTIGGFYLKNSADINQKKRFIWALVL